MNTRPRAWAFAACAGLVACATTPPLTLVQQADKLRREQSWGAAYEAYGRALCAEAPDARIALAWIEAWVHLGQPGEPHAQLGCSLPAGLTAFSMGLVRAGQGRWQEADAAFASAAESESALAAEALYRRGLTAIQAKDHEAALAHLQAAAGRAPQRADIRLGIAQARLEREEYGMVAAELEGMLRIGPNRDELTRGRAILARAVARSQPPVPEGVRASVEETLSGLDRGELDHQASLNALALAREVVHPRVLMAAGMVALRMGLHADAARWLEEAARLNSVDPDPLRVLAGARAASDRPLDAVGPLREALRRDPLDLELARLAARVGMDANDAALSLAGYRRLTVLEAEVPEHHLWVARLARQQGELDLARVAVEAGYDLTRTSIPVLVERAVIHARLAHTAPTAAEREAAQITARNTVDELLAVAPEHPSARVIIDSLP